MKKMLMKIAALAGGAGVVGYMYFKKHPEKIEMMKCAAKDASRTIYNKLDEEQ
ncbi:MAG: hypothetical protein HFE81_02535 [Bacilli bacterium]|nr:hypothetical protein [Bacilli bacterium]